MKTFVVVVRATVTKTMNIVAADADEARQVAHETFSVESDDCDENYEQDILTINELEGEKQ